MANRFPLTLNTSTQSIEELPAGVNLDLTSSNISNIDSIQLSNTFVATNNPGQLSWNSSDGTVNIGMLNGVTQQVGQETYYYIRANTTITNGQVVMFAGAQGDHLKGDPANTSVSGFKAEYIMGIATQNITANSMGYVTSFGMISDLNTFAFNAGDILYLSPNTQGELTATEPTAPNPKVSVAACVVKSNNPSATNGRIFVRPQPGSRLFDLSDVQITTPASGQGLVYNGTIWVNGNVNYANNAANATTANTALTANTVIDAAQANITSVGTLTGLTINGISNLGSNANVKITGGTSNQLLQTDGAGNLSWTTLSSSGISNGTSNINIPIANGNILLSSNGVANVMTITDNQIVIGAPSTFANVSLNTVNDALVAGRRVGPAPGYIWTISSTTNPFGAEPRIAYGDGKFVVCGNGQVGYSYDGIRWTTASLSGNWKGIAYGNGLFVMVGQLGIISTSPDGITWTSRTSPANVYWFGLTYGNGLFVACAYNATTSNTIMTSPDGINWTLRTTPAAGEFVSMAYGAGTYVAIAFSGGSIMSSTNGITWTSRTNPSSGGLWSLDVKYGNGLFVAVAGSTTGRVVTSPDGITWTIRNGTAQLQSVAYGDGLWVALGTDTNKLWTSLDGITWINRPYAGDANATVNDIAYGNGIFVGVGIGITVRSGTLIDNDPTDNNKFYGDWQFTSNVTTALLSSTGNVTGGNLVTANGIFTANIAATGNANIANLVATGNMTLPANLSQAGGTPVSATDTTIAYKMPIVINGVTYYIALTAAQ